MGAGDPYRSVGDGGAGDGEVQGGGIVEDIIGQFADAHAFVRELVQNAIDADTPEIEVRATWEPDAGVIRVAVVDRGEGMTREVIENQLLVLFRSTKETDSAKIGKFGIGFASVLAPDPEVVIVKTARDGRRLELHLARDLTYRLFDAGRGDGHGTSVEVEVRAADEDAARAFALRCAGALVRWCRHATVPITWFGIDGGAGERVDSPLALDGSAVVVRAEADGGQLVVIAGLPPAGERGRTELYNHGLTLYETTEPLVRGAGGVVVKIQDARLGHTLTRDNVRRDAAFARAIAFAGEVIERLRLLAQARIQVAAKGVDGAHGALVDACIGAGLALETVAFPVAGGGNVVGGGGTADLCGRSAVWASASREIAMRAAGEVNAPIFWVGTDGAVAFARRAAALTGGTATVTMVEQAFTQVTEVRGDAEDGADVRRAIAVVGAVGEALARARCKIDVVPARLACAGADSLAVAMRRDDRGLVDARAAQDNPFGRLRRARAAINVEHPIVRAAAAMADLDAAADLVARALLVRYGQLDAERSAALLDAALARLGVAG